MRIASFWIGPVAGLVGRRVSSSSLRDSVDPFCSRGLKILTRRSSIRRLGFTALGKRKEPFTHFIPRGCSALRIFPPYDLRIKDGMKGHPPIVCLTVSRSYRRPPLSSSATLPRTLPHAPTYLRLFIEDDVLLELRYQSQSSGTPFPLPVLGGNLY